MPGYLSATRHPWACLLFLLPLLTAYELGVLWLGGDHAERLRNGADAWLRWGLDLFGVGQAFAPLAVILVLLAWSWWRWSDRPRDPVTAAFGMAFESAVFAAGLWQFSRNFGPLLDGLGVRLDVVVRAAPEQILTFIGAGIYEEVLFRLGLFGGLYGLLRVLRLPAVVALVLAAAAGAVAFAAAHHVGPYGEPVRADHFAFRTCAGLYFTALLVLRGFGVAVGAHAGYDVLVGVGVG
ncbi:MAG: CPBP family intramembrane metalloprotease [Isosphaera sp.]|nr:CPBP family intramembrane metalloprotease [Isosphaera sp.]